MESSTDLIYPDPTPQVTRTLLLVEDDAEVREITRAILRKYGYVVLTAESECQALWLWERHQIEIELLIADMMIPNCATGLALAKRLCAQKPGLKVLITSGFSREIGGEETSFLARTPFLQKPYSAQALMDSVTRCLKGVGEPATTQS